MAFSVYSGAKISLVVGGIPIRGWVSFNFEYLNPRTTVQESTDGVNRFVDNISKAGTITLVMKNYSTSMATLQAIFESPAGVPIICKDSSANGEIFSTGDARVEQISAFNKNLEGGDDVEWIILCTSADVVHTGAKEL